MSSEIIDTSAANQLDEPKKFQYWVLFHYVKEGIQRPDSLIIDSDYGLTVTLMGQFHLFIRQQKECDDVMVINVIKLEPEETQVYPH